MSSGKSGGSSSGTPVSAALQETGTSLFVDIFISISMWTLLTEMVSMVWFLAVIQMAFTGFELFLLFPISLGFLSIPLVRKSVHQNSIAFISIGLMGFLSPFADDGVTRLVLLSCSATSLLFNRMTMCLLQTDRKKRSSSVRILIVSLLITAVLRRMNSSLSPLVVNRILAALWLALGFFILIFRRQRQTSTGALPRTEYSIKPFTLGAILGAVLFLTMFYASEASVVVRSAALPSGALSSVVLLAGWCGLLIPITVVRQKWFTWTFGIVPLVVLGFFPDGYVVYFCGCLVVAFCFAIWPSVCEFVSSGMSNIAIFFPSVFGVYFGLIIVHVYASVYKFVPLGSLLRERPYVALLLAAGCLIAYYRAQSDRFSHMREHPRSSVDHTVEDIVSDVMRFSKKTRVEATADSGSVVEKRQTLSLIMVGMFLVICLLVVIPVLRSPSPISGDEENDLPILKTAVWNVRYAMSHSGAYTYGNIIDTLREIQVDIVGLIETDHVHIQAGNRDTVEYLADKLGFYSLYGPGPRVSTFGVGLLSRYPIAEYEEFPLPSPQGELAPAIDAVVIVRGRRIRVFVTHFGNTEDTEDLELQSSEMVRRVRNSVEPCVFLSYITSTTDGVSYKKLRGAGLKDTAILDTHRYCEYIFYRGMPIVSYLDRETHPISDTELDVAVFLEGVEDDPVATVRTFLDRKIEDTYDAFSLASIPFGRTRSRYVYDVKKRSMERVFLWNNDE